jgi:hypothetical protein
MLTLLFRSGLFEWEPLEGGDEPIGWDRNIIELAKPCVNPATKKAAHGGRFFRNSIASHKSNQSGSWRLRWLFESSGTTLG